MLVGSRQKIATITDNLKLSISGILLRKVNQTKYLGILIDHLTWNSHITSVARKVSSGIGALRRTKPFIPKEHLINIYRSIIEPYFDYCCIVWDGIGEGLANRLQKLQNRAGRVITGAPYTKSSWTGHYRGPLYKIKQRNSKSTGLGLIRRKKKPT